MDRRVTLLAWAILAAAPDLRAASPAAVSTAADNRTAIAATLPDIQLSRSRRFSASGPDPRVTVPLLDWTEDIADRLERAIGETLPCPNGTSFRLIVGPDGAPDDTPAVRRELAVGEAGVSARLFIASAERADPAVLLDALVSLMLARHVIARQPPASWRAQPRDTPEWFSVGLAAGLYPGPRARAQRDGQALWTAGRETTPDRVLAGFRLPAGARDDRAMAAALVGFLRSRPDFGRIVGEALKTWAAGGTIDATLLARMVNPAWTPAGLRQEWDLWLAGLRQFDTPWALTETDLLLRCREVLQLPAALVPVELPADAPGVLTPEAIVERRDEPWAKVAALRMIADLDRIPAGQVPAATRLIADFRNPLAAVGRPRTSFPRRLVVWNPGTTSLLARLASAREALDDLEALAAARADVAAQDAARAASDPALGANRSFEARLDSTAMREIFRDTATRPSPRR